MRFSWLAVPLVALTLAWRLAAAAQPVGEDADRIVADTAALLAESGFRTSIDVRDGPDAVLGARGACQLAVVPAVPSYGGIALFRRRYAEGRRVSLFYRDRFVAELPRWRATTDYYLQRAARPFGMSLPYPPLVLLATGPQCDPGEVDWGRLQFVPRSKA